MKYAYWCNNCENLIKGRSKREKCVYCGSDDIVELGIPVDEIPGIGPTYKLKVRKAGIHNVLELAKSNVTELSKKTDISEKKISEWIDFARMLYPDYKHMKPFKTTINLVSLSKKKKVVK